MSLAHKRGLSTLLDCLGDLIEVMRWSPLAKFMNVSVTFYEIKTLLQSNHSVVFGKDMWDKATELVQKCHRSFVFITTWHEPNWTERRGFRSLAKLILEVEGQLNTCIDVLKVITIAAAKDFGEAEKRADGLENELSNQENPLPINVVTKPDVAIQSQGAVRKIRKEARQLSLQICRSLSNVLDEAARRDDPIGCPGGFEDYRSREEDRGQLAKRWFPIEYEDEEPVSKPFGALESRIVEVTQALERTAGHNIKQVEPVPAERSDHSEDEDCAI
ncbi:unnamed protein product [Clonostachys byssicola]|uniref:Uncharacterized protein n=1 Tax=Clonostachys byssicola TaxID=160290 RepID=A0A9N9XYR3_9HYPO|nr:unnamed protein product [Clonostachys byssicola]